MSVVTGGCSGIGAAVARRFALDGDDVVVIDRVQPPDSLRRWFGDTADGGTRMHWVTCDLADDAAVENLARHESMAGTIQKLVNCAGIGGRATLEDLDPAFWDRVVAIDLRAPVMVVRVLRERLGPGAAVVNVGSISGISGDYGMVPYNAAKGGLVNVTRALALELARRQIRVNSVCPGVVQTPLAAAAVAKFRAEYEQRIPLGRIARVEDVSGVVAWLCGPDAEYVTGQNICVDGGLTAWTGQPTFSAM